MRNSEFWELVEDVFGRGYGRSITSDLVLADLNDRTALRALDEGVEPRRVWHVLCDAMQVSAEARWGTDPFRQAPPR